MKKLKHTLGFLLTTLSISAYSLRCTNNHSIVQTDTSYGFFTINEDSIGILKNTNKETLDSGKVDMIIQRPVIFFNVFNKSIIKYDLEKRKILSEKTILTFKDFGVKLKEINKSNLLLISDTKLYIISKNTPLKIRYSVFDSLFKYKPYLENTSTADWKINIVKEKIKLQMPQQDSKPDFIEVFDIQNLCR